MPRVVPDIVPHCPQHPDVPLEPRRRGWYCPECNRRVLSYGQWARPTRGPMPARFDDGLDHLPWLVATPLAMARDETRPSEERAAYARVAVFETVRLAALLLLAEAQAAGGPDADLAAAMGRLALPGWRPWLDLAERLVLRTRTRSSRFGHLLAGWALMSATGGLDPLRALRGGTRTASWPGGDDPTPGLELATAERVAVTLFSHDSPRLVRLVDEGRAIVLHGVAGSRSWRSEPGPDPAIVPHGCRIAAWGDGGVLPLEPFAIPGPLVRTTDGELAGEPALGLLIATDDGGFFQGLEVPVRLVRPWGELGCRSVTPVGVADAGLSRQSAATLAAALTRHRIADARAPAWHVGPFLPRPEIEERLATALRRPGRAVLVAGEAGAGKTVLLARLASHLLAEAAGDELSPGLGALASGPVEDPDVVAMVSGPGAWTREGSERASATLSRVVALALGADGHGLGRLEGLWGRLGASGAHDRRLGRKVWLLLDGLDEDEHGAELVSALDSALPTLAVHPWLRLVLSLDITTCRRLDLGGDEALPGLESWRFLERFTDPATARSRPWLELPPLSSECEVPAHYESRQRADPSRACPLPLAALAEATRQAARQPLAIQLLHESHRCALTDPGTDDLRSEMARFWVRHGEATGMPVPGLAVRLWASRTPGLPMRESWSWSHAWFSELGERARLHAAHRGPVEALLAEGLLRPPGRGAVWPPAGEALLLPPHPIVGEGLLWLAARHDLAGRELPTGDELARWLAAPGERWSLRNELAELLRSLAARLATAGELGALDAFLSAGQRPLAVAAVAGALTAPGPSLGPLCERWASAAAETPEAAHRLAAAVALTGLERLEDGPLASLHLRLLEALSVHEPDNPAFYRQLAVHRLAAARRAPGPSAALPLLRDARRNLEVLRERWPAAEGVATPLASTLAHLGEAASALGLVSEGHEALRRALPLVRALLAAEPGHAAHRLALAGVLVDLADIALDAGRHVEAERLLGEVTVLASALRAAEPEKTSHQRLWGRVLQATGQLARAEKHLPRAWALLEEAAATLRPLAEHLLDATPRLELGRAVLAFADLALEERQGQAARSSLEEGLRVLARPTDGDRDPALDACEAEIAASLARTARDQVEEWELLERCHHLLWPLVQSGVEPPRTRPVWRRVLERRQELAAGTAGTGEGPEPATRG